MNPKFRKMGLYTGLQLQKLLMNPEKMGRGITVDHKDGNEDNYQKDNLRVCTHAQNMKNRKKSGIHGNKETTSKYKGVSWQAASSRWLAKMFSDNRHVTIGYYSSEIAAASAYNHAAKFYHGEFARLNDLGDLEMPSEECEKYRLKKNKTSKYKGVSFVDEKWLSQIWDNKQKKTIRIGSFDDEYIAAIEYDKKAIELWCSRARVNFPLKENRHDI